MGKYIVTGSRQQTLLEVFNLARIYLSTLASALVGNKYKVQKYNKYKLERKTNPVQFRICWWQLWPPGQRQQQSPNEASIAINLNFNAINHNSAIKTINTTSKNENPASAYKKKIWTSAQVLAINLNFNSIGQNCHKNHQHYELQKQ